MNKSPSQVRDEFEMKKRLDSYVRALERSLSVGDSSKIRTSFEELKRVVESFRSLLNSDPSITIKNVSLPIHERGIAVSVDVDFNISFEGCSFGSQLILDGIEAGVSFVECKDVWCHFKGTNLKYINIDSKSKNTGDVKLSVEGDLVVQAINILNSKRCYLHLKDVVVSKKMEIKSCEIESFDGEGMKFGGYLEIYDNVFEHPPKMYGAKLPPSAQLEKNIFSKKNPEGAPYYRYLKAEMKGIENTTAETLFKSMELECRYMELKLKIGRSFSENCEFFFSKIYKLSNLWGREAYKPLIWIFWIFIFSSIIYSLGISLELNPYNKIVQGVWRDELLSYPEIASSLIFSFVNSLGPLKLLPNADVYILSNPWHNIFPWAQSILTSYLWFLFISGVRKTFKTH